MPLTPSLRRTALVAHVVSSIGWLGTVAAFLVLSVTALRDESGSVVVACYIAMDVVGRYLGPDVGLGGPGGHWQQP